ncbi:hypothetical protein EVAR_864_1 [Eumeta japonica]|uniref:Uncharacterized protein n=1 Tax=Eumeta variegata TaxID=151549 RepID=A0A4C1SDL5_EUMVA|nr:hypothetical protein EVAR_864_1 [Eumeta japonica]
MLASPLAGSRSAGFAVSSPNLEKATNVIAEVQNNRTYLFQSNDLTVTRNDANLVGNISACDTRETNTSLEAPRHQVSF